MISRKPISFSCYLRRKKEKGRFIYFVDEYYKSEREIFGVESRYQKEHVLIRLYKGALEMKSLLVGS